MSTFTEEEHKELFIMGAISETIIMDMIKRHILYDEDWEFWEGEKGRIIRQISPYGKSTIEPLTIKLKKIAEKADNDEKEWGFDEMTENELRAWI